MDDVTCAVARENLLGEGPVWDARARRLYWVDIKGRRLEWLEPADGRTGACILASSTETDVRKRAAGSAVSAPDAQSASRLVRSASLPQRLLWSLLAVLLIESFLFHRKAVY